MAEDNDEKKKVIPGTVELQKPRHLIVRDKPQYC